MAALTTAAPAAADAPKPAGSGASTASATTTTTNSSPVSLESTAAFDVEDMLTGEAKAPEPESKQDQEDPNPETAPTGEEDPEGDDDNAPLEGDEPELADEVPEEVEDQNGKRLVSAKHLERALKQRATAKANEREALARAEAAEKQASELKAQIEAGLAKPIITEDLPLARLAPRGMKFDPNNAEQVTRLEEHAQVWLDWCERHPTGGAPIEGGEEWTADEVVDQKQWAQQVLKAVPAHQKFLTDFADARAKTRAEHPKMFQAGTEEAKAYADWQGRLLNFRMATDQDAIIAKLVKLDRMEREEREGVASYPRVPKVKGKAAEDPGKPRAKPLAVTTRPVVAKPTGAASEGKTVTMAEKLAAGPQDVEALFETA